MAPTTTPPTPRADSPAALGVARRAIERLLLRSRVAGPRSRSLYWRVAPVVYRRWVSPREGQSEASDPFELHWVDPDRISRFTRRVYPPYHGRSELFGAVRDGDWDVRPAESAPEPPGTHPPRALLYADRLEETPLYEAFEARFERGVPWRETAFVRELRERCRSGERGAWQGCTTEASVLARCHRMDGLYESIVERGCQSQRDRARRGIEPYGFRESCENEVVVDVGRDGEPLLVSGKHRVIVSKLAGVRRVPVLLLVRHADWEEPTFDADGPAPSRPGVGGPVARAPPPRGRR